MTDGLALVGDVGGTNARFALARWLDGRVVLEHHESFPAERYPTFADGVRSYLEGCPERPTRAVVAVAGPVRDGAIDLTNSPWAVSEAELEALGPARVRLINDFEAQAWATAALPPGGLMSLGGPAEGERDATVAVLGPGTGFGVAALVRDGHGGEAVMPGEGGHVSFAPEDEVDDAVLAILRRRFGRVSVERLISGSGLVNLHQALAEAAGRWPDLGDPAEISRAAILEPTSLAGETLTRFCAILGSVAGDVALLTGARGGVYVAGGVAPRIRDFLATSPFRERFERKGRFETYVGAIPTWLVTYEHAALLGAARFLETHPQ